MTDKTHKSKGKRTVSRIPLTPASHSPGKLLRDAYMRLSSGLVSKLEEAGYQLSVDAWAAISFLWEEDNRPQFEIGACIDRDRHQTSRLISSLHQQGLVTRESGAKDNRVKHVVLTDTGRAAKTTLRSIAAEYLESTFTGVTQEDYDGFIRCLQHIVARLEPKDQG